VYSQEKVWVSYNSPDYLKERRMNWSQNITVVETLAAKATE